MGDKPVYSTKDGSQKKQQITKASTWQKRSGPTKMRLETKGRGGKTVTVLFNLPFDEAAARTLLQELQARCGCGGTMTTESLELRGDLRERLEAHFAAKGWPLVRAGG